MNWLIYLLEANAYLIIFFGIYKILFEKETFYTLNRFFLLLASVFAFILPFIKIGILNPQLNVAEFTTSNTYSVAEKQPGFEEVCLIVYLLIIFGGLVRFAFNLTGIYRLISSVPAKKIENIRLIQIAQSQPFSFFNYLFIDSNLEKTDVVMTHEKTHIKQFHSADVLFFELLHIVNWFNPLIILLKQEIKAVHEYLADEEVAKADIALDEYASFLIQHSRSKTQKVLINQMFNHSLLKKRIIMLGKKKSVPASRLKYGVMLAIIPAMVCGSSFALTKNYGVDLIAVKPVQQNPAQSKKATNQTHTKVETVVIQDDALSSKTIEFEAKSAQPKMSSKTKDGKEQAPPPPPVKFKVKKAELLKPEYDRMGAEKQAPPSPPKEAKKVQAPPPPTAKKIQFPKPVIKEVKELPPPPPPSEKE